MKSQINVRPVIVPSPYNLYASFCNGSLTKYKTSIAAARRTAGVARNHLQIIRASAENDSAGNKNARDPLDLLSKITQSVRHKTMTARRRRQPRNSNS